MIGDKTLQSCDSVAHYCLDSYRVFGLYVDLISPDDPILLVIRGRLPVDHHCAGVEWLGRHLKRLSGHWSSQNLASMVKKKTVPLSLELNHQICHQKCIFFNDFPITLWRKDIWYFAGVTPLACEGLETPVWFKINNDLRFDHHWLYSSDLFWPKKEAKLCNRRAIFWTRMQRIPIHNKYYSISQLVPVKESPNIFSLVHPTYLCDSFTRSFNWSLL